MNKATKPANTASKNKDGDTIFEKEQILSRWVQYLAEFSSDDKDDLKPQQMFHLTN